MFNLKYPSETQLRYAQSVLPFPEHIIIQLLIEADDETFNRLCSSDQFKSFCSINSTFSERIYDERAKRLVERQFSKDLIQFKPADMKWREFYIKMKYVIDHIDNLDPNILAEQGMLFQLKMLYEIKGEIPNQEGINLTAKNGRLDVLRWIYEKLGSIGLPDQEGLYLAAGQGQLEVLKWIFSINGALPFDLVWIARQGYLDVLKWIYSINRSLPDQEGIALAAGNGQLDVLKWIYEINHQLPVESAVEFAESRGHFDVGEWVRSKRNN
ncbi:MAG: hypothetical protein Solivirus3_16 [Solivirus sp.]|uniref:Ankyrin repeat protein n=1 Tax=Solivirus sp. TaxID=2487772 RepID=A0A3G5AFM9_9VIRU|nr:MAG: hypothetical protein Solivirus3_16 [Solivirus sp.]